MNIKKVTCLISGKTWTDWAKYKQHDNWLTFKMKNKDSLTFHQDNPTMKVEYEKWPDFTKKSLSPAL